MHTPLLPELTLFESDDRLGGHAHTHELATSDDRTVHVDSGFIVHNERTYPNLLRLFAELGVATQDSDMSMSVQGRTENPPSSRRTQARVADFLRLALRASLAICGAPKGVPIRILRNQTRQPLSPARIYFGKIERNWRRVAKPRCPDLPFGNDLANFGIRD